jgi:ribosomal protein S17E
MKDYTQKIQLHAKKKKNRAAGNTTQKMRWIDTQTVQQKTATSL